MNGIRQSLYSLDLFSLTFRKISLAVLRRGAVATVSVCLSVSLRVCLPFELYLAVSSL